MSVRCDAKAKAGRPFDAGVCNPSRSRSVAQISVSLADAADGGYHEYSLGRHPLELGMYVWVAPCNNSSEVEAVCVDRVFLVR